MEHINGGVTAAKGFTSSGIHCGIRKNKSKKDLALILSSTVASAAAVYTTNLVQGAPIAVTKANIANGKARAIICNSGNANTCNANGKEIAQEMCRLCASELKIDKSDVIVASTGVIGQKLSIDPIANAMGELAAGLGKNSNDTANAIMTTDTHAKESAVTFTLGGKTCKLGGIAKGSGMIEPNMATLLVFLTTDVAISPALLQKALSENVEKSFNMLSIDSDTSTNDMAAILANGQAENELINSENSDYTTFKAALFEVMLKLCKMIAADGEGASKLIECEVKNAPTAKAAKLVAKSVINSPLFKTAMFGADANWGRVLCAIGYSGAEISASNIDVSFSSAKGEITVCKGSAGVDFSEEIAKEILLEKTITVKIDLHDGDVDATSYGCDLTYDYVKINGDYRT